MKIVKKYDKELVSDISFMCNDISFTDFKMTDYGAVLFKVQRELAKEYNILERVLFITLQKEDLEGEIILPVDNFIAEYKVLVNNTPLTQVNRVENSYEYRIYYNENHTWVFDYKTRSEDDEIEIYYTVDSIPGEEYDGTVILPDKFYDEIIRKTANRIAKLGLIKFNDNDKERKYRKLLEITDNEKKDTDRKQLQRNDAWSTLKIYNGLQSN